MKSNEKKAAEEGNAIKLRHRAKKSKKKEQVIEKIARSFFCYSAKTIPESLVEHVEGLSRRAVLTDGPLHFINWVAGCVDSNDLPG